jgi:hypothetical protein
LGRTLITPAQIDSLDLAVDLQMVSQRRYGERSPGWEYEELH